jgi:hypothetical protein
MERAEHALVRNWRQKNLLEHDSRFAQQSELLGSDIGLQYYCWIGSSHDGAPDSQCGNSGNSDGAGRIIAQDDTDARYVRIFLDPDGDGSYSVRLFFLPVLSLMSGNIANESTLSARATAGRTELACGVAPFLICTNSFDESEFITGRQFRFPLQGSGSPQGPGTWGFIQGVNEESFCTSISESVGFPLGPGSNPQAHTWMNPLFGMTGSSDAFPWDFDLIGTTGLDVGSGDWDRDAAPGGPADPDSTRLEAYGPGGDRSVLIPRANCPGSPVGTATLDRFARFFVTEPVSGPGGSGLLMEFVHWADDFSDEDIIMEVVLYE